MIVLLRTRCVEGRAGGAAMLAPQGIAADVAAATTRNILTLAEEAGYIASAATLWSKIIEAVPTANPASVFTIIKSGTS